MTKNFLFLLFLVPIFGIIEEPSELNCNFEYPCHWFNGTTGLEDNLDWSLAQAVMVNNEHFMNRYRDEECPALTSLSHKLTFHTNCDAGKTPTLFVLSKAGKASDRYSFAAGQGSRSAAWLVSAEIPRQVGAGVLRFSLWRSSESVQVYVCGRKPPGYPTVLDCSWHTTNTLAGVPAWQEDRALIPPNGDSFEIVIVAQFINAEDVVAIDNIRYEASLGGSNDQNIVNTNDYEYVDVDSGFVLESLPVLAPKNPKSNSAASNEDLIAALRGGDFTLVTPASISLVKRPKTTTGKFAGTRRLGLKRFGRAKQPKPEPFDFGACSQVSCKFEVGMCEYHVDNDGWKHSDDRAGNRITGIKKGVNGEGGFLFSKVNEFGQALLHTPKFHINSESVLTFYYHMASHMGRLRICEIVNQFKPFCTVMAENSENSFQLGQRGWQQSEFTLSRGEHQLVFVADKLDADYLIGLDHIQLWTSDRKNAAPCIERKE